MDWINSTAYKNEELAYDLFYTSLLQSKSRQLVGLWGGQCVAFAKRFTGYTGDKISGQAKNTEINSDVPQLGAIVRTSESQAGHVAVVIEITEKTKPLQQP